MKVLTIVALLCVALPAKAAADPVETPAPENNLGDATGFSEEEVQSQDVEELAPRSVRMFCPDGWFSYQSKCYTFVSTPLSWFDAEKHCNELGASLASTGSSSEYRYLQQITRTANRASAWIGGFYLQGSWLWIDRSGMYYTNWNIQSSPTVSSCMYLQSTAGLGWRNSGCGTQFPFICVNNYRC